MLIHFILTYFSFCTFVNIINLIHLIIMAEPQQPPASIEQSQSSSFDMKKCLKIVIISSIVYLTLVTVSIQTLAIVGVIVASLSLLIKLRLQQFRSKGPNNFSPKLRQLLFQKSIFDIYSDIIYFPTISRIIGAFVKPMLAKPAPQDLKQSFINIHPKAQEIISTKGLVNIFPTKVRELCYKESQPLPPVVRQWTWHNSEKYKLHEQVHQDTMGKRIIQKIDNKIDWSILSVMALLVAYGIKKMNPQKAKKMFIQNGCFAGILIVILIGLIKISRRNKRKHRHSHIQIEAKVVQE